MGEQLSFLPDEPFFACLPPKGSQAETALFDLLECDLMQRDWLGEGLGKGWRLAAAVKELDYLGWQPKSIRVGREARYSLPQAAKEFYFRMMKGDGYEQPQH
jgi:hypothetical protein